MRLILALLLALPAFAQAATFQAVFSYDFTGLVQCSATVPATCIDHFELGLLAPSGAFTTIVTPIPIPAGAAGPTTGINSGPFQLNAAGTYAIAVVAVGKDSSGNRLTSSPQQCTVTVVVGLSAPTGLVVTQR